MNYLFNTSCSVSKIWIGEDEELIAVQFKYTAAQLESDFDVSIALRLYYRPKA